MPVKLFSACVLFLLVAACTPTSPNIPETQIVRVYATPATHPWLREVFACAPAGMAIRVAQSPVAADITLRLGEPDFVPASVYQIGTDEILIVTHRQRPVQTMTVDEVRELFAGQGDSSVQVWVYAPGEDVQRVFEQAVMDGRSVTSLARLATSPQHVSDIMSNDPNAIGILPRQWTAGDMRFVYTIPDVPVLALLKEEPRGALQDILSCMQTQLAE